jgi:hypothetical protein
MSDAKENDEVNTTETNEAAVNTVDSSVGETSNENGDSKRDQSNSETGESSEGSATSESEGSEKLGNESSTSVSSSSESADATESVKESETSNSGDTESDSAESGKTDTTDNKSSTDVLGGNEGNNVETGTGSTDNSETKEDISTDSGDTSELNTAASVTADKKTEETEKVNNGDATMSEITGKDSDVQKEMMTKYDVKFASSYYMKTSAANRTMTLFNIVESWFVNRALFIGLKTTADLDHVTTFISGNTITYKGTVFSDEGKKQFLEKLKTNSQYVIATTKK